MKTNLPSHVPASVLLRIMDNVDAVVLSKLISANREVKSLVTCIANARLQHWDNSQKLTAPFLLRLAVIESLQHALIYRVPHQSWPRSARWPMLVGNALQLGLDDYDLCQKEVSAFSQRCISKDVKRIGLFPVEEEMKLERLLLALSTIEGVGYCAGMNFLAAKVLACLDWDEKLAFFTLANFLSNTAMFTQLPQRLELLAQRLQQEDSELAAGLEDRYIDLAMFAAGPMSVGFLSLRTDSRGWIANNSDAWELLWDDLICATSPGMFDQAVVDVCIRELVSVRPRLLSLWVECRRDEFEKSFELLREAFISAPSHSVLPVKLAE